MVVLGLALAALIGAAILATTRTQEELRGPASVVLVVLDNVRADHTSLCGYDRPTTPVLESLAHAGAVFRCSVVAPGSWTLPSHASFFTGVSTLDHGAHELPLPREPSSVGIIAPGTAVLTMPLDLRLPTLAETLKARGYQPRLVSMNPVLGEASGLQRGFDPPLQVARSFHGLDPLASTAAALRSLDPDGGPLFLVLNLTHAHQPWLGVPDGLPWVQERSGLAYGAGRPENVWTRWYRGELSPAERASFLETLRDNYDYGVQVADSTLGLVLDLLDQTGWCREACRVVVTSDHGELLGEAGLIDHGFYVNEGNARVPLLVKGAPDLELPERMTGAHVFHILRDGSLPVSTLPTEQAAWSHPSRYQASGGRFYGSVSAARWEADGHKLVWMDGLVSRYDLVSDPEELRPSPAAPDREFQAFVERVTAVGMPDGALDPEVEAMLQASGYLEPSP